jgi:hypothetical protein
MRLCTSDVPRPADRTQECTSRLLDEIFCRFGTGFRAPQFLPRCTRNGEMKRSSAHKLAATFLVIIVGTAAAISHLALRARESLNSEGARCEF